MTMTPKIEGSVLSGKNTTIDHDVLLAALEDLTPGGRWQRTEAFRKAYPIIERQLAAGVPQKAIVKALSDGGLSLSLGGFKSLLDDMRDESRRIGDQVRCRHCNSVLPRSGVADEDETVEQSSMPG